MASGLTAQERKALGSFAEGLRGIFALQARQRADSADIVFHVHAIQSIVMARAAARAHPDEFNVAPGFE